MRSVLVAIGMAVIAYALSDHPFYGGAPGFGADQAAISALGVAIAAGALLPAGWRTRLLLLTLSSFVMLAVAELAGELVLGPRFRAPYDHSERYLFRLRPGSWSRMTHLEANGGNSVLHHVNSRGYRGDELLPPGSAKRVVVFGDSFIHAFYTPDAETFTEQLERNLGAALGAPVEVVNAGTSSYGPDQNLLRMTDELGSLSPELVVFTVFAGNDFGDLIRNKLFELDDSGGLRRRPAVLAEHLRVRFALTHRESILRVALRRLGGASSAGARDASVGAPGGASSIADTKQLLDVAAAEYESYLRDDVVTEPSVDRYNADASLLPDGASARYKVRLMEAVLRRAAEVARARSVPFTLLFVPHPVDVLDEYEGARVDQSRFPAYRRSNLTDALEGIAVRNGIDYVNLFDPFRARSSESLYYHAGDDHWNSAGQRLAADVTARHVLRSGALGALSNTRGAP